MMRRLLGLILLVACAARANAQPAPYHRWQTLDTPHFHVHAPIGLEREGRVAGAAAERAYEQLSRELVAPRGPIDLVISDDADYSNGNATPFPSNRIVIFLAPPIEAEGLRFNDGWIDLVVTHELTHIFHLDRSRGIWASAQRIFGRAPFLFPNVYSPSWLTEGLAVYYESRLTPGGRLNDASHRDYARAAALEDRFPNLGDLSLATPRFPGGDMAYGYGSLFLEFMARSRGDSSIPRFVEEQSREILPFMQQEASGRAFGIDFARGWERFRDSVEHSVRVDSAAPTSFAELTTHGYYAMSPRWLDDSTIVYAGSDGKESSAAFIVHCSRNSSPQRTQRDTEDCAGTPPCSSVSSVVSCSTTPARTRLGRRSSLGANVPMPGGGLLFAQPEYVGTEEVRSDLYIERDGVQRQITRGARLIQPDVRRDGTIVAVQLDAARARLVLLDSSGDRLRVLKEAGPGETWSEPRWSPDGREIVAVSNVRGTTFSMERIDPQTGDARTLAFEPHALVASPSWTPDGSAVLFTSEASGTPQIQRANAHPHDTRETWVVGHSATALLTPELSPNGRLLAAVQLRADGYHIVVAPAPAAPTDEGVPRPTLAFPLVKRVCTVCESYTYHPYRAGPSLRPRYWMPIVESSGSATRLGAFTSGNDAIGRHAYEGYVALGTDGQPTGSLAYRYAGFSRPFVDVSLLQEWESRGLIIDNANASLGTLLRRTQDAAVAATWTRPRYRTYAAVSAGLGVERRIFATDPAPLLASLDPTFAQSYMYPRAFVSASWSNTQRPRLAISPEDGVTLAMTVSERLRTDDASRTRSTTAIATVNGYRALTGNRLTATGNEITLGDFAHDVLALRLAGGIADARATSALEVGGTSSGVVGVVPGVSVGEGRHTFGVRGFPSASIYGTRALAASAEYRAPIALGGVGTYRFPTFFDRSSASAFADAGTASCDASPLFAGICSPAGVIGRTIASVGVELAASVAVIQPDVPFLVRVGLAVPVLGRAAVNDRVERVAPASVYVAFGYSF